MKGNTHSPWDIPSNRPIITHGGSDGTTPPDSFRASQAGPQRLACAGFGQHQTVVRTATAAWLYPTPEPIMTTRSPHLILPSSMCEAYNRVYEQLYGSR